MCMCVCMCVCVCGVWGQGWEGGPGYFLLNGYEKKPQQPPKRDSTDVNFQILTGFSPPWHPCWISPLPIPCALVAWPTYFSIPGSKDPSNALLSRSASLSLPLLKPALKNIYNNNTDMEKKINPCKMELQSATEISFSNK